MDAWGYKTVEQWQRKVNRQLGESFKYVYHKPLTTGLWADVMVKNIITLQTRWIRLFF